jgi:hypothetical protein
MAFELTLKNIFRSNKEEMFLVSFEILKIRCDPLTQSPTR